MFNNPLLLMGSRSTPQAVFSLRTPYLYLDSDYCGNPMHEPNHTNGSGAEGPCGGAFYLDLLDANGNVVSTLENKDRYIADPYRMYEGTWGDFYESARTFNEPLALAESSDANTPIRSLKFNLGFGDADGLTMLTRDSTFEANDRIGSIRITIETASNVYQLVRNSAIYCYTCSYSWEDEDLEYERGYPLSLSIRNMYGYAKDLEVTIPESTNICYRDIKKIYISVTAGIVAWLYLPDIGDIV